MGTGQTLITVLALFLFSLVVLNVNRGLSEHDISLSQNRYRLEALSIATSYVQQATQYYFDEIVADSTNTSKTNLDSFTHPHLLGFEETDSMEIDDFDDYNNLTKIDTGKSGVEYKVSFKVEYVDLLGQNVVPVSYKTFHKMMTIYVSDNYAIPLIYRESSTGKVKDTVKISFIYSYWFYN